MTTLYDGSDPDKVIETDGIFWIVASNGAFLRRPTLLGNVVVPHKPTDVPEWPHPKGLLDYSFPVLPASLVAQTHDWFRRIFAKYKTEAEVLLTHNPDAEGENVRIFIPVQKCSHGGVHSAYDPSQIARGWQVIGSIHSHCDFSAFHSGTDTNDASEFDGLHITMGHVNKDTPSIDAMVAFNKVRWSMKIDDVADTSEYGKWAAPMWWDRYHIEHNPDPVLAKLFEDFRPPAPTERKVYSYGGGSGYKGHGFGTPYNSQYTPPANQNQRNYSQMGAWGPDSESAKAWIEARKQRIAEIDQADRDDHDDLLDMDYGFGVYGSRYEDWKGIDEQREKREKQDNINWAIDDFADIVTELAAAGIYPIDLLDESEIYGPRATDDDEEVVPIATEEVTA